MPQKGILKRYIEKEYPQKRCQDIFSFKQPCVFCLLNAPCAWKCHILGFRPRRKLCFCRFLFVRRGGNAVFLILRLSAVAEMLFYPFFTFQPWRKRNFSHFLLFSRGGNDIFVVFYSSAVAESRFSSFSHFHPWMTDGFLCFSRFVG